MSEESKPIATGGASSIEPTITFDEWLERDCDGGEFCTICDSCERQLRASLSTAEKERTRLSLALAWAHMECNCRMNAVAVCFGTDVQGEYYLGCPDCCDHSAGLCWMLPTLSGSIVTDAPTAPSAPEIASDSSALEKALGALRAAREWVKQAGYSALGARNLLIEIDAILSGGAHVDGPKAPKEEVK